MDPSKSDYISSVWLVNLTWTRCKYHNNTDPILVSPIWLMLLAFGSVPSLCCCEQVGQWNTVKKISKRYKNVHFYAFSHLKTKVNLHLNQGVTILMYTIENILSTMNFLIQWDEKTLISSVKGSVVVEQHFLNCRKTCDFHHLEKVRTLWIVF